MRRSSDYSFWLRLLISNYRSLSGKARPQCCAPIASSLLYYIIFQYNSQFFAPIQPLPPPNSIQYLFSAEYDLKRNKTSVRAFDYILCYYWKNLTKIYWRITERNGDIWGMNDRLEKWNENELEKAFVASLSLCFIYYFGKNNNKIAFLNSKKRFITHLYTNH